LRETRLAIDGNFFLWYTSFISFSRDYFPFFVAELKIIKNKNKNMEQATSQTSEPTLAATPVEAPKYQPIFNETFAYVLVTSVVVFTYTVINLVALVS